MKKINLAIIGVGLIGGSLGLVLKEKLGEDIFISGLFRREKSLEEALKLRIVDYGSLDPQEAVENADIVYIATPVLQIVPTVKKIIPYLKQGAIITDAGSTKKLITGEILKILPEGIYFVPGHPMTGREKSGARAAKKDLFQGKAYVIIEDTGVPKEVTEKLMWLLEHTGAKFEFLRLEDHDRFASRISHIPHIAAAALVHLLMRDKEELPSCVKLIGGGFKDTTRIASSNADMWTDICLTNKDSILSNLEELKDIIGSIEVAVKNGDRDKIHEYFTRSRQCRDSLLLETAGHFDPN